MHGSDDEKDKESDDDYDIDNEFFVPHGHLSDEEVLNDDEIEQDNSPDAQKAKLKIIQKEFADEMKRKTEKIKPRLIGVIWQNLDGSQPTTCPKVIWDVLSSHSMIFHGTSVPIKKLQGAENAGAESGGEEDSKSTTNKKAKLTAEMIVDLIHLLHGNINTKGFLMKEFRECTLKKNEGNLNFKIFSNMSIRSKMKELAVWKACPEEGILHNKYCWYVSPEKQQAYGIVALPLPNNWTYLLPNARQITDVKDVPAIVEQKPVDIKTPKSKATNVSIAKFTKVFNEEDKKKQFSSVEKPVTASTSSAAAGSSVATATSSDQPIKKRVNLLMSVPRGQDIPAKAKNALISQFLQNSTKKSTTTETEANPSVIEID